MSLTVTLHDLVTNNEITPTLDFCYEGETFQSSPEDALLIQLDQTGGIKDIISLNEETTVSSYDVEKIKEEVKINIRGQFQIEEEKNLSKSMEFDFNISTLNLIEEIVARNREIRNLLQQANQEDLFQQEIPEPPQTVFENQSSISSPQAVSHDTRNSELWEDALNVNNEVDRIFNFSSPPSSPTKRHSLRNYILREPSPFRETDVMHMNMNIPPRTVSPYKETNLDYEAFNQNFNALPRVQKDLFS